MAWINAQMNKRKQAKKVIKEKEVRFHGLGNTFAADWCSSSCVCERTKQVNKVERTHGLKLVNCRHFSDLVSGNCSLG